MSEKIMIEITKEEKAILDWLNLARAKRGDRPVLELFCVTNDAVFATDSYRAHFAEIEHLSSLEATNEKGQANFRLSPEPIMSAIPDGQVFPDASRALPKGDPVAFIFVNPRYLIDALRGFREAMVCLSLHEGETVVIQGARSRQYAMIRGFHSEHGPETLWKPQI